MCILRTNIKKNCRKCKSSVRHYCTLKKKTKRKIYTDNKTRSIRKAG